MLKRTGKNRAGKNAEIEATLQRAANALQSGNAIEAERSAFELLTTNPGDPRAAHIYGHALYLQGRGHEAIAPLERAAQRSQNAVVETQLGMLLREAGRSDDALERFRHAVNRQPSFPPAFLEYGSLLLEMLRYDEAAEILERGRALAPDFAELLAHLGAAYAARGQRDKAEEAFAKAATSAPHDPDTMFKLACLMKNGCCFGQAVRLFRRLLDVDPNDNAARINLGICLLEIGETAAGFDELRAVGRADRKSFGYVLGAVSSAGKGRFWIKRTAAEKFFGQ